MRSASAPIRPFKSFGKYIASMTLVALLIVLAVYISSQPVKRASYEGISLGMDMSEVKYILGYPDSVLPRRRADKSGPWDKFLFYPLKQEVDKSPNGVNDFPEWEYHKTDRRLDIGFEKSTSRVRSIGCHVELSNDASAGVCAVNGIKTNDAEELVYKNLGAPTSSEIDGVTKTIKYANLNMTIRLTKKAVYYITIEEMN